MSEETDLMVTDWFRLNYFAQDWTTPKKVAVKFYSRTPAFYGGQITSFAEVTSLASLQARPEWVEARNTVTESVGLYAKDISGALQLGTGSWSPANIETDDGWELSGESDVIAAAVVYYDGTLGGVTDPVLFATKKGIGTFTVVHEGSVFGQTAVGVSGTECLVQNVGTAGAAVNVAGQSRTSDVATVVTATNHNLVVGDVVYIASIPGTGYNGYYTVTSTPTATTFTYDNTGQDSFFTDTFDRADSTTTLGADWTVSGGVFGITSNKAYCVSVSAAPATALYDTLDTNHSISIDIASAINDAQRIIVRYADANNYVFLTPATGFGTWNLNKRVGGSNTFVANLGTAGYTGTFRIEVEGTTFSVYLNDVLKASPTISDGALQTGTSCGFGFNTATPSTSLTYDNAEILALGSATGTITNQSTDFISGSTLLNLTPPAWESAHAQHVWIEPQRVNFIANPSFELSGGGYWVAGVIDGDPGAEVITGTATIDRVSGGIGGTDRPYCGHAYVVSGTGRLVVESNYFPKVGTWLSVVFSASGDAGDMTFGIVTYDASYTQTAFIYSGAVIPISGGSATGGYTTYQALIPLPDDVVEMRFRIEHTGTELWIDNVMVDPHEGQFAYFDGASVDGLPGDFMWHGGSAKANAQFSLWYNNYINTKARLIGDLDVNENAYKEGMLEDWAPTGSSILAHWEAVTPIAPDNWQGDAYYPISEVSVGTVTSTGSLIPADEVILPPETFRFLTESGDVLVTELGYPIALE